MKNAEHASSLVVGRETLAKRGKITIAAGRSFHFMGGDIQYAIHVDRALARRDPLVAALSGAAPSFT
ncbi:MAG: hypothetical protein JWR65_834 [Massilia sp.]|jgi:hypothetical protein|nr:hypothetical protein [Massilia sp.]